MQVRIRTALMALALMLFMSSGAGAFFPENEDITARLAEHYGRLTSLEAALNFSGEDLRATEWLAGDRWAEEWISTGNGSPAVVAAGIGFGGHLLASYPGMAEYPRPVLSLWRMADPERFFSEYGIDLSQKRYGFSEGRPCLILGNEQGGCVWLDAETFAPLAISFNGKEGRVSIEFSGYSQKLGFWVPGKGRVAVGDVSRDFSLTWGRLNTPDVEAVFSSDAFARRFSGARAPAALPELFETLRASSVSAAQ